MDYRKAIEEKLAAIAATAKAAEDAGRDLTGEERATIKRLTDEARDLKGQMDEATGDAELLSAAQQFAKDLGIGAPGVEPVAAAAKTGTLGQRFTGAEAWQDFVKAKASAFAGKGSIGNSPVVEFAGLKDIMGSGAKDLVTGLSDTSAGALVQSDWLGLPDGMGTLMRELRLRQLVTNGTTGSDTVEYARQTSFTNAAAPVAEATDAGVTEAYGGSVTAEDGGVKPESAWATEKVLETVKTVAHWIPATKRALSDAGQVRTILDSFLRYGLEEEIEDQIVNGDGTGENFDGLLSVSGVQAQAFDTDLLTTYRKALTKVRVNGKATVTGVLVHPNDDEALDLLKDDQGRFYFGGPVQMGTPQVWGRRRIVSEACPEGTAIAGDWRYAVLWDREQASVQAFDQHADFAIRNLVAFLAELRAAFGIIRPAAFCTVDLTAGS